MYVKFDGGRVSDVQIQNEYEVRGELTYSILRDVSNQMYLYNIQSYTTKTKKKKKLTTTTTTTNYVLM